MQIVGLDVGRCSAVLCCLNEFPTNILQQYKKLVREKKFLTLNTDTHGANKLLSLGADGIVIEPTGHWYSHFWASLAQKNNIRVYWISHTNLDKLRGSYGFVNKRDTEDALCLAASYFDDRFIGSTGDRRYLNYYYGDDLLISAVRERFLEKEQLQKLRSSLVLQLRQRLAYEYPEVASQKLAISEYQGFTPLIGWLAQIHSPPRIITKYRLSVVQDLGISISPYTRAHAQAIVEIERRLLRLRDKLGQILDIPEYQPYFRVFDSFGFGLDNKILLLYHCYPFDKFLVDGKPWIEREESKNGKLQKRDRSLRKFQAFLGLSYSYRQSGDSKQKKFHGSRLVRSHLYPWAVCRIAPAKSRIDSEVGKKLKHRYGELRENVRGKDAIVRILFYATRLLYRQLLTELTD